VVVLVGVAVVLGVVGAVVLPEVVGAAVGVAPVPVHAPSTRQAAASQTVCRMVTEGSPTPHVTTDERRGPGARRPPGPAPAGGRHWRAGRITAKIGDMASKAQRYPDMWVDPEDDPRRTEGNGTGEREVLRDYLRHFRLTFEMKCEGLDAEQLARRSVEPSSMSLLGLLRHLAAVEHTWFRITMAGEPVPRLWGKDENRDADFDGAVADEAVVAEAWRSWREEVANAEAFVDHAESLEVVSTHPTRDSITLRELLVHLIEEYARHCGHADLIRERIDGRTGQ
jgi:uncharacterized damage-inducible protein DinB